MALQLAPSAPLLNKANLDRVKAYLLQHGERCFYSNRFNHSPCLVLPDMHLFLDPDPGPDGNPQWNLNCEVSKGDFNTLVVLAGEPDDRYQWLTFFTADTVMLHTKAEANPIATQQAKISMEKAVRAVLDLIAQAEN